MKINKIFKKKNFKSTLMIGLSLVAIASLAYYLATNQDDTVGKIEQETVTTTDQEIQDNIEKKGDAVTDEVTITTPTVTEEPIATTMSDVSLTIMKDGDQAYVSVIGPTGTYGAEKFVNNSWEIIESGLEHSSVGGGSGFDTILSTEVVTHYRIFRLVDGARVATSGDTVVTWQEILSKGILTVPLAE